MAISTNNKFIESIEKAELIFCNTAFSFLQSDFWGAFKSRFGWNAHAYKVSFNNTPDDKCKDMPLLVLSRTVFGIFSLAYVPWGPELPLYCTDKTKALLELAHALKNLLPKKIFFIRFDPPWQKGENFILQKPLIRGVADIQPPSTVVINLELPMEKILEEMKSKWRYNARLAIKKGVIVREAKGDEISKFYELLKTTAIRDGIAIHSMDYYRELLCSSGEVNKDAIKISLYFAEHEEEILAGIVTLFRGREAVYLYGASSDNKRNFMAPYALQLKAMEDAKAYGCKEYDLFGIPPNEDPSHPMAGLYKFKTGFGGSIIHRPGSLDFPCCCFIYFIFRSAEFLRLKMRNLKKQR